MPDRLARIEERSLVKGIGVLLYSWVHDGGYSAAGILPRESAKRIGSSYPKHLLHACRWESCWEAMPESITIDFDGLCRNRGLQFGRVDGSLRAGETEVQVPM